MTDEVSYAFPHPAVSMGDRGMTLRDYFAGQALASIPIRNWNHIGDDSAIIEAWARCAYATADAMLQQRDKQ